MYPPTIRTSLFSAIIQIPEDWLPYKERSASALAIRLVTVCRYCSLVVLSRSGEMIVEYFSGLATALNFVLDFCRYFCFIDLFDL